jgi:predicted molibdopterin-dependent oxidoreductase YjgC
MSEDAVNITVDGVPMKARKGEMIIRVTDANDVYVPRFCYHEKLPVAANCRMCLVEVEKAPKPLPACATPVAEGMVIHTKSPKAIAAQRSVMEFLLKKGIDLNAGDTFMGESALTLAYNARQTEAAEFLKSRGAKENAFSGWG